MWRARLELQCCLMENLTEQDIQGLGEIIHQRPEIREMYYISAEDAWNSFKEEYFAGHEELAEGFAEDNPLAGSASYEIFLNDISQQDELVAYLQGLDGVRQVNYSNSAVAGFSGFNRVIGVLSSLIIGVLLAVSLFLINNTISVAAAFRRQECQIMRLIGATNFMIRAPFIVEGVMIGLIGALTRWQEPISSIQKELCICLSGFMCSPTCFILYRLVKSIRC